MRILIPFFAFIILLGSCRKNNFISSPDAIVALSADSLKFDTVFTSTGSVTQFFKIFNNNDQKLRITNVSVKGGAVSSFHINVDGTPGPSVSNIDIEANDSIYVFVSVTINPKQANLPFIVADSVGINYNGKEIQVQLQAYGQNANFMRSKHITRDTTWTNSRPFVILGGLQVDAGATLTLAQGCRLYLHADAPIIVDGTLDVQGQKYDSTKVLFRGDRLDDPYKDYPAAWPGIFFRSSSINNVLQYAEIRNAYQGVIVADPAVNANPKLRLDECILDNIYDIAVYGIQSSIVMNNCLISNSGKNLVFAYGGTYRLNHCTAVSISNAFLVHKDPVLFVSNFVQQGSNILSAPLDATFKNSIFWGDNGTTEDELVTAKAGSGSFLARFDNCLWKVKNTPADISGINNLVNQPPAFDSINQEKKFYSFRLQAGSPAIDKGIVTGLNLDLDGNPRPVKLPDIGCYEKQ